jgi:hypothetical protein
MLQSDGRKKFFSPEKTPKGEWIIEGGAFTDCSQEICKLSRT